MLLGILIGMVIGMSVCAIVSGFLDDILERLNIIHCRNCSNNKYCKMKSNLNDKNNGFCSNAIRNKEVSKWTTGIMKE